MEKTQANKLKLNATNIKSFLFGSNKKLDKMQKEKNRLIEFGEKEEKFREKEKRIESPINLKSPLTAVTSFILAGPMSIFDKLKEFFGIILLGLLVNNLPQIIQKIKDFFNDPFVKGTLKVLKYMGKGFYEIIKSTITFTAATQKRITEDIKKIKKDTEYLLETFGFLEKDVDKDISDLQGSKTPNQKRPPTAPSVPTGTAPAARPARSVPLTYPGAPANPTPTTATQPGNNPFSKVFAKGGTVTSPNKPKKNETTQTPRNTTSFSKRETGKLKKARKDMNYFENFNKSIKELVDNNSFEEQNNKIFEEMVNNFKAFSDLMGVDKDKKKKKTSPGSTPGGGQPPGLDLAIEVDPDEVIGTVGYTGSTDPVGPGGSHIHIENLKNYSLGIPSNVKNNILVSGVPMPSRLSFTSGIGWRWGRTHRGEDYAGDPNQPITLTGGLKFVGYIPDQGDGYGNKVLIRAPDGTTYSLNHLNSGPKNIKKLKERQLEKQRTSVSQDMTRYNLTGKTQTGKASFYGGPTDKYWEGRRTASGEVFNSKLMTAASNTFALGTVVRVTNKSNGKSVIVRINDTGGFNELGRVIDLSRGAMEVLGGVGSGVVDVKIDVLEKKKIEKMGPPVPARLQNAQSSANFEGTGGTRDQNAFLPLNNKETNMVAMMMTQPVIQPYPVPVPLPMKSAPVPVSSGPPVLTGAWSDLG